MIIFNSLIFLIQFVAAEPVTQIEQRHISPICSTARPSEFVSRVSLPNTHVVLAQNSQGVPVYRSNSPYLTQHVLEIMELKVESVVVFKNFYSVEDKELLNSLYQDSGFESSRLVHIPMPWKREGKKPFNFKSSCEMTVQAMDILLSSKTPVLFHCTVGEDRTGMLAGLLRIQHQGWSILKAFRDEMCARGYEAGNPKKVESPSVVSAVREALTPLYLKMATVMAQKGRITKADCAQLPSSYIDNLQAEEVVCESVAEDVLCPIEPLLNEF
ncbi:MAG: tyrosine-protein phosphatase [Bdellovibrionaceae bacterium]|nr:tyrosine-protein phosphatase [Pseudobdellovibrionaceae bacterium]